MTGAGAAGRSAEARVVNEHRERSEDLAMALDAARAGYERRIAIADEHQGVVMHIGEAERTARSRVAESLVRLMDVEGDVAAIKLEMERRVRALRDDRLQTVGERDPSDFHPLFPPPPPPPPPPPAGIGELWWIETQFSVPSSPLGLNGFWDDAAGGMRLFGRLQYDDGDLWQGSVRVLHRFGLGRNRRPENGRYLSSPVGDLTGVIAGFIGEPWWFGRFFDSPDHWSTADLALTQTVLGWGPAPGSLRQAGLLAGLAVAD